MTTIHSTAIVDPKAELDASASVGPYAVIGPHVRIGAGTSIGAHCVIDGHTTIGRDNRIFQFNSLGAVPQDKKYAGEPCELVIGDRNTIREFCTFNIGSPGDAGVTRIGWTTGCLLPMRTNSRCGIDRKRDKTYSSRSSSSDSGSPPEIRQSRIAGVAAMYSIARSMSALRSARSPLAPTSRARVQYRQ